MENENNNQPVKFVIMEESALENLLIKCIRNELSNLKTNNKESENRILFIEDAMKFLGVSRQTIYGYTSRNTIPFYKKAKKLYFLESDLVKWLNYGKNKSLDEIREDAINYLTQKDSRRKK